MANAKQVEELIIRARVRMLLRAPFFGNLATRLILKDGSGWIPTAATDGKYLYYNVEFFSMLDKKEMEFVVAHEVMHCVYDHTSRRGSRDPRLWNCAGDYVINWELMAQKIGRLATASGIKCLYDAKYADMASEEVYNLLLEDQEKGKGDEEMDSFDTHLDPDDKGQGKGGEEECDECGGTGEQDDGEGGTEECEGCGGSGKKPGKGGSPGGDDPSGMNGPIPMDEEERRALRDEIKQATMEAAKVSGAGNVPAGVRRMIKDLTSPQMDWREILNMQIQSCIKSDFTFARPNRKMWGTGIILPGMLNDNMLDVDICIDTSGSISERMLRDFLSEIKGIMDAFTVFTLRIWTFDTKVYNMQTFGPENLEELLEYDIQGGGGTDFMVNWDFMKEEGIEPHRFIVMTDGYPWDSWGDENYCDTVFLIHGNDQIVAPFGMTVYYQEDEHTGKY